MRASRRSFKVLLVGLVCLFACLAWLPPAEAGRTGGSMGGGSWGSRSSSSSSSSSSWSSSSSSHSSSSWGGGGGTSYGYSYSSGGGGGDFGGGFGLIVIGIIVVGAVISGVAKMASGGFGSDVNDPLITGTYLGNTPYFPGSTTRSNYADVTVLRIALDGRARKFVQTELARIAKVANTATAEGRSTMLREVALLLRRLRDAWVYGGAVNEQMREEMAQKAVFDRYVDDARVRFMTETVRNEQGQTTTAEAPAMVVHGDQGEGLILVTIVIAAHSELFEVGHIGDGADLRQALESASHRTAEDLIAIEIIWMPSEDEDRLTSIELEAKYPKPDLIPIQGALVGKVFCAYCSGPFPGELVSCPHCGAPAAGAGTTVPPGTSAG